LGVPVWVKPAKFAFSIAVYCLSLAWIFGFILNFRRTRQIVRWITVSAMWIEMVIISFQAARGTTSHFNISSPLNATLFSIMGVAIVSQTLASIAVAVALFRQPFVDRALGLSLRLAMAITISGALLGGLMTQPSERQLDQMRSGQLQSSGAHTVGGPDGEPGMPVTGFSKKHGDLRIPHFLGLHALQLIPLFALGLRRSRATEPQRVRLVRTFAASYVGLVAILLGQALRGQSLFTMDGVTATALFIWAMASAWFATQALTLVEKRPEPFSRFA
jgi:hypothetical protein